MELFKTIFAYSWLFIYFRKYLRKTVYKPIEKLPRRHSVNSFNAWRI